MNKQELTEAELERYRRQIAIRGWGPEAQHRLKSATVGIAGVGGLGSAVALYLAAAGVGTILLCDNQRVELSNLNRQVLYSEGDIGSMKTAIAGRRLLELNQEIRVEASGQRITDQSVASIFGRCDLIIDCLDNYETRYVVNRFAVANSCPFIHAAIEEYYGQMLIVRSPETACLECLLPSAAGHGTHEKAPAGIDGEASITGAVETPSAGIDGEASITGADQASVVDEQAPSVCGPVAGVVGSLQAMEACKIVGGVEKPAYGELLAIDVRELSIDRIPLKKDPGCPVCG